MIKMLDYQEKVFKFIMLLVYKEVCAKGKDVEKVIHNYLNRLKPLYESIIKPTE